MYTNPLEHFRINIKEMISLDANEALVVYREDGTTKEVSRYVQFGPTLVMPQANEWWGTHTILITSVLGLITMGLHYSNQWHFVGYCKVACSNCTLIKERKMTNDTFVFSLYH